MSGHSRVFSASLGVHSPGHDELLLAYSPLLMQAKSPLFRTCVRRIVARKRIIFRRPSCSRRRWKFFRRFFLQEFPEAPFSSPVKNSSGKTRKMWIRGRKPVCRSGKGMCSYGVSFRARGGSNAESFAMALSAPVLIIENLSRFMGPFPGIPCHRHLRESRQLLGLMFVYCCRTLSFDAGPQGVEI